MVKKLLMVLAAFVLLAVPVTAQQTRIYIDKAEDGRMYEAHIVSYIPIVDREPKLLRVYDPETRVVCFVLQNNPYRIVTGLQCFPLKQLDIDAPFRMRN